MDELELFSFELDDRTFENENIYYLELPKSWSKYIDSKKTGRNYYQLSICPTTLGKKLQTFFSNIFFVSWNDRNLWLLADEIINEELLKKICLNWLADEEKVRINELPLEMREEKLEWRQGTIKQLIDDKSRERGRFQWIPAFVARRFARENKYIAIEGGYTGELHFSHINYFGTHECMSQLIRRDEKSSYFAYVIRFEYKTRGTEPERGILNASIGMRRVVQEPLKSITQVSYNRNGTILIGMKSPFYDQAEVKSLTPWKFKRRKGTIEWGTKTDELFANVAMTENRLNPLHILQNPNHYLENDNIQALAVYSDQVYQGKNLRNMLAGVGLPEKWALFNLVRETFSDLKPLEKALRVKSKVKHGGIGSENFPLLHSFEQDQILRLEVWNDNDGHLYQEVIETLFAKDVLKQQNEDGTYLLNAEPLLSIDIVNMPSEKIVHSLKYHQYKENAERAHIQKVKSELKDLTVNDQITISLIEIDEKDQFAPNEDPKDAIRTAFANHGRVTQFIHPKSDKEGESGRKGRILNSIYDLLTDLGFLPTRFTKLRIDESILSFSWIVGDNRTRFPVLTLFSKGELKIKLFGKTEWHPLRKALFKAAEIDKNQFLKQYDGRGKMQSFFQRGLLEVLDNTNDNIIVLVDARLRSWWKDFTNGNIDLSKIPFNFDSSDENSRVRFVRVNTTDELPQYRINPKGEEKVNRYSGLFLEPNGIYYSVSSRPDTMQNTALDEQKFRSPNKYFSHQRMVELIPLGCTDVEERNRLADLVYQMRRLTMAYDAHTVMPYPLHMLNSLRKHMTFLKSDFDASEFDETVIEEVEQLVLELEF